MVSLFCGKRSEWGMGVADVHLDYLCARVDMRRERRAGSLGAALRATSDDNRGLRTEDVGCSDKIAGRSGLLNRMLPLTKCFGIGGEERKSGQKKKKRLGSEGSERGASNWGRDGREREREQGRGRASSQSSNDRAGKARVLARSGRACLPWAAVAPARSQLSMQGKEQPARGQGRPNAQSERVLGVPINSKGSMTVSLSSPDSTLCCPITLEKRACQAVTALTIPVRLLQFSIRPVGDEKLNTE
jgi:hypothetical protein